MKQRHWSQGKEALPLFAQATDTRNEAFRSIKPELGARQADALEVIKMFPEGLSNAAIARVLGLDINQVTPRVHELRALDLVERAGDTFDNHTGRRVATWKIKKG